MIKDLARGMAAGKLFALQKYYQCIGVKE